MNIARWLMKLVRVATPDNRVEWAHAMAAEFAALDRNANPIAWAAGCLGTVVMWRLQTSARYLILLAALPLLWNVAISTLISVASISYAYSQHLSQREMGTLWMALSSGANQTTLFLISAGLCAYRPRHALFSAIVLWLATTGASFLSMFAAHFAPLLANAPLSSENNHPALPNVAMALSFAGFDMWPVVVGGFAGWAFARGKRLAVAASATVAFALISGFAAILLRTGEINPALITFVLTTCTLIAAALILAIIANSVGALREIRRAWNVSA